MAKQKKLVTVLSILACVAMQSCKGKQGGNGNGNGKMNKELKEQCAAAFPQGTITKPLNCFVIAKNVYGTISDQCANADQQCMDDALQAAIDSTVQTIEAVSQCKNDCVDGPMSACATACVNQAAECGKQCASATDAQCLIDCYGPPSPSSEYLWELAHDADDLTYMEDAVSTGLFAIDEATRGYKMVVGSAPDQFDIYEQWADLNHTLTSFEALLTDTVFEDNNDVHLAFDGFAGGQYTATFTLAVFDGTIATLPAVHIRLANVESGYTTDDKVTRGHLLWSMTSRINDTHNEDTEFLDHEFEGDAGIITVGEPFSLDWVNNEMSFTFRGETYPMWNATASVQTPFQLSSTADYEIGVYTMAHVKS